MDISLQIQDHGWLHAAVADGTIPVELRASFLSDALTDFIAAVTVLMEGQGETHAVWLDEPGEYWWHFLRQGREVSVQIHRIEKYQRRTSGQGQVIFTACEDICRFARQLRRCFASLDTSGYDIAWGYPYPREWVERLGAVIKKEAAHIERK